jgi:hypothetical protein
MLTYFYQPSSASGKLNSLIKLSVSFLNEFEVSVSLFSPCSRENASDGKLRDCERGMRQKIKNKLRLRLTGVKKSVRIGMARRGGKKKIGFFSILSNSFLI